MKEYPEDTDTIEYFLNTIPNTARRVALFREYFFVPEQTIEGTAKLAGIGIDYTKKLIKGVAIDVEDKFPRILLEKYPNKVQVFRSLSNDVQEQ